MEVIGGLMCNMLQVLPQPELGSSNEVGGDMVSFPTRAGHVRHMDKLHPCMASVLFDGIT